MISIIYVCIKKIEKIVIHAFAGTSYDLHAPSACGKTDFKFNYFII